MFWLNTPNFHWFEILSNIFLSFYHFRLLFSFTFHLTQNKRGIWWNFKTMKAKSWIVILIFLLHTNTIFLNLLMSLTIFFLIKILKLSQCGPRISAQCVSHSMASSIFISKNWFLLIIWKWLGVATYFCFIFKG